MLYWINQFAVLPDHPGGTRHYEMARELVRKGVPAVVVASDLNLTRRTYQRRSGAADRRYLRETVESVDFAWLPAGSYQANDWRRALSMVIFSTHVLWFLMRAPMPEGTVLIGSTPHLLSAAAARVAAFIRRVPFVLEVRDLWPESLAVSGKGRGLLYRGLRVLADVMYRTSPSIIVLASGNIEHIQARGISSRRIHYIPNGVDPAAFEAAAPVSIAQIPDDKRTFVYAGAHGPANGLETVLEAAQILQQRGDESTHVLLVGDGPTKAELLASARRRQLDNVSFADPVPKALIPGLLKACAAGIMPLADVELFSHGVSPNKLFDYLSANLPVVANVPGDVARMVQEAKAGIVVPPADAEALADAMLKVSEAPDQFEGGLTWIRDHHDRTKLVDDLINVIEQARSGAAV